MRLSELPRQTPAIVRRVIATHENDLTARRLQEIGFINGERVEVMQYGPFGKDPVLIQIGYTRFALRQNEAHRVELYPLSIQSANNLTDDLSVDLTPEEAK